MNFHWLKASSIYPDYCYINLCSLNSKVGIDDPPNPYHIKIESSYCSMNRIELVYYTTSINHFKRLFQHFFPAQAIHHWPIKSSQSLTGAIFENCKKKKKDSLIGDLLLAIFGVISGLKFVQDFNEARSLETGGLKHKQQKDDCQWL